MLEGEEGGGDHVGGEFLLEELLDLGEGCCALVFEDEVGGEGFFVLGWVADEHGGLGDERVLGEDGLDFVKFDAEAAQFDLVIHAAEELDIAVGQGADFIAGFVKGLLGIERAGDKFLGIEFGSIEITASQAVSADEEFTGQPRGHGLEVSVQDVDLGIADGFANGYRTSTRPVFRHGITTGKGGVFRGAVAVDQLALRKLVQHFFDVRHRKHIASGQKLFDAAQALNLVLDHLMEQPGGEPESGDLMALEDFAEFLQRGKRRGMEHQAGALKEAAPDFQRRRVKGDRRKLQENIFRTKTHEMSLANQTDHRPVRHGHPFGLAGGAGCIKNVSKIFRRDGAGEIFPALWRKVAGSTTRPLKKANAWRVISNGTCVSSTMNANRSSGKLESSGTYAPPALRMARMEIINSNERSKQSPTRTSGPTPHARK